MKQFRRFLYEGARSPERADKLAHYVAQRHAAAGKVPNPEIYGKKIRLAGSIDEKRAGTLERALEKHIKGWGYSSDKTLFDQHSKLQSLPINSLRAGQDRVNHSSGQFHGYKLGDRRPIYVVKHKGEHIIYDGHHRWIRDRLLGQKHIAAYVFDADAPHPGKKSK